MKKVLSFAIALCLSLTLVPNALATTYNSPDRNDQLPFTVLHGTFVYDPSFDAETRAVSVPTTYAPKSWYNVDHYWTARYYTWSSYILSQSDGYYFDCRADSPFTVELYYADGEYIGDLVAEYSDVHDKYWVWTSMDYFHTGYYVKIVNNGDTPITSGATYKAYFN